MLTTILEAKDLNSLALKELISYILSDEIEFNGDEADKKLIQFNSFEI